jgi:hypothetical protein
VHACACVRVRVCLSMCELVCVCARARACIRACVRVGVGACMRVRVRASSARHALQWTVASSCAVKCSSTSDSPRAHARAAASLDRLAQRCRSNSSCCRSSRRRSREPCAMADPFSIDASRAHIDHTGQYSRDRTISVPRSHSPTRTRTHALTQACARAHACACTHKHTGTRTVIRCPHTPHTLLRRCA